MAVAADRAMHCGDETRDHAVVACSCVWRLQNPDPHCLFATWSGLVYLVWLDVLL